MTITIETPELPTVAGAPAEHEEANIISLDSKEPTDESGTAVTVPVDSSTTSFTVSLSGEDPAVTVYDPLGTVHSY